MLDSLNNYLMKRGDNMEDLKEILILLIVLVLVSNFKPIHIEKTRYSKRC